MSAIGTKRTSLVAPHMSASSLIRICLWPGNPSGEMLGGFLLKLLLLDARYWHKADY
jgi:hypothetical protein